MRSGEAASAAGSSSSHPHTPTIPTPHMNPSNGDDDTNNDHDPTPLTPRALASLLSTETQAMSGLAANLRGTANFIRRHGRPPRTTAELNEGMSLHPPFPTTDITDPNLLTYLKESDAFLEFFEGLSPSPDDPT